MSGLAHYGEPFKGKDGLWYFHLQGRNGEIVEQSEGYDSKANAERGIQAAVKAAQEAYEPPEVV